MIKNKLLLLLFQITFCFSITFSQKLDTTRQHITLTFAGDLMCHMPQLNAAYDNINDSYDFTPCFQFLKPYLQQVDVAVVNLETVFGENLIMVIPYSPHLINTPWQQKKLAFNISLWQIIIVMTVKKLVLNVP